MMRDSANRGPGKALLVLALVPFLASFTWFSEPNPKVERGNAALAAGNYRRALELYRSVRASHPSAELELNIGLAYYGIAMASAPGERAQYWREAERSFAIAAGAEAPAVRGAAYYNLGNVYFQLGRYAEALDPYRRSLIAAPDNSRARYNLELALRRIEQAPPVDKNGAGDSDENPTEPVPSAMDAGTEPSAVTADAGLGTQDGGLQDAGGAADAGEQSSETGTGPDQQPGSPDAGASAPNNNPDNPLVGEEQPSETDVGPEVRNSDEELRESLRKLEKLERRSRELRRRRLRGAQHKQPTDGGDW